MAGGIKIHTNFELESMVQVEGQGTCFEIKELNCKDKLESIPVF